MTRPGLCGINGVELAQTNHSSLKKTTGEFCLCFRRISILHVSLENHRVFLLGALTGSLLGISRPFNQATALAQFARVECALKSSEPACVLSSRYSGETLSPVSLPDGIITYVHLVSNSVREYSFVGLELCPQGPAPSRPSPICARRQRGNSNDAICPPNHHRQHPQSDSHPFHWWVHAY